MATLGIRPFESADAPRLAEILARNGQYAYPDVEGPAAMRRVAGCEAAVFLVAERDGAVVGFVRAVYDGGRALIHLLSVHPDAARQGVGTALVLAVEAELARRGAPGAMVPVTEDSAGFWGRQGYQNLPVRVMLKPRFGPGSAER